MKLYRALLHFYPASFRAEYGREMTAIFERRLRQANGAGERVPVWLEALIDVTKNAPAIHWDILRQDLRFAARTLSRTPGLSLTVMLVAALGIGATTAAFTLADHVLIKPMPFDEPDRLVKLWQDPSRVGNSRLELSPANYRDWKAQSTSFEGTAAFNVTSSNLVGSGDPLRLDGCRVTGDLFDLLGVGPLVGRALKPEDDVDTAGATVVLSERLWRDRFGANSNVIGTSVILDDRPRTIVGVMPRTFEFPSRLVDFWIPFQYGAGDFEDRGDFYLQVVGRLKAGVPIEQPRSEVRLIAQQLERLAPRVLTGISANVIWLRDEISQQSRMLLIGLVAASVGLLLIACTNLANLLLTRALSRQRELAVRAALGAGRDRLVRQMFTESFLIAAGGGVAGIALAAAVVPFAARLVPTALPIADTPGLDGRMLIAAALVTLATAIGFGVIPALRLGRDADTSALREGARAGTGRRTERLRSALVIAQVTASVVLLVSSGLLLRAMWKVQQTDPGFKSEGVLTLRTALPRPKYDPTELRNQFYNRVLSDVRALPGVSSAGYISFLPMVMRGGIWGVTPDGKPDDPSFRRSVSLRYVTPGFFTAMGIPVQLVATSPTATPSRRLWLRS